MTISEFIESYREAFGNAAPLPIALAYNIAPATEIQPVPKCMIGASLECWIPQPVRLFRQTNSHSQSR